PTYIAEIMAASSADVGQVAAAYVTVRDVYGLAELNARIDQLDGSVPAATQLLLYAEVQRLLQQETLWFLRNADFASPLGPLVECFGGGVEVIRERSASLLPDSV